MKRSSLLGLTYAWVVRRLIFAREIQSLFWSPGQVSILVCIVYRYETANAGDSPRLVKDFVFGITDDLKHHSRVRPCPTARLPLPRRAARAAPRRAQPRPRPCLAVYAVAAMYFGTCQPRRAAFYKRKEVVVGTARRAAPSAGPRCHPQRRTES